MDDYRMPQGSDAQAELALQSAYDRWRDTPTGWPSDVSLSAAFRAGWESAKSQSGQAVESSAAGERESADAEWDYAQSIRAAGRCIDAGFASDSTHGNGATEHTLNALQHTLCAVESLYARLYTEQPSRWPAWAREQPERPRPF
jgi:hypothetical protein